MNKEVFYLIESREGRWEALEEGKVRDKLCNNIIMPKLEEERETSLGK